MFNTVRTTLSHLPINAIVDDIATAFKEGKVPIVTAEVASGKTLLIPAICAERLDEPVYVLEPTRFLANNAAETMTDLLNSDYGCLIGCLNSNTSDYESYVHKKNRVIFTTVGFALNSGIVHRARNIIFDEAHDTSIDLSLAKAIVERRRRKGEIVRTAILSATIDFDNEWDLWKEGAVQFETQGGGHPVEFHHRPGWSFGECVRFLVEDDNKKGIMIFVSGKEEIEEAALNVQSVMLVNGYELGMDYEIATIHGNSTGDERAYASAHPILRFKVLIGTNVMESGISLPWIDSGITSGETKIFHVANNIRRLEVTKLPLWRMDQQKGRVGRFGPGTFILNDSEGLGSRQKMFKPDIVRLPLTEFVMHCAKIPDLDIEDLRFPTNEQPTWSALREAIDTLKEYGLIIEKKDTGSLVLSEDGEFIEKMPVTYRAAAGFCEAIRLESIAVSLPILTLIETGDLRYDHRTHFGGEIWECSDLIHTAFTIANIRKLSSDPDITFRQVAEYNNLNTKKYREFVNLLSELERFSGMKADFNTYLRAKEDPEQRRALEKVLKQVIFRSMITERYKYQIGYRGVNTTPITKGLFLGYGAASISKTSVTTDPYGADGRVFITGNLRTIKPKGKLPFTVAEMITVFTTSDIPYLSERFGADVVNPDGIFNTQYESHRTRMVSRSYEPEPIKEVKSEGNFGLLLKEAFAKQK